MSRIAWSDVRDSPENLSLQAPRIVCSPGPEYAADRRAWQGIPGIERAANGRLWAAWYTGGQILPEHGNAEGPGNHVVLATSADDGRTWRDPVLAVDPEGPVRAFDPVLWRDPAGRLWLFWAQSYDWFDARIGVWAIVAEDPDFESPAWSPPRRLCGGILMHKPVVLDRGEWLLPAALWRPEVTRQRLGYLHSGSHVDTRSNVYVSRDQGASWRRRGGAEAPDRTCDEHLVLPLRDGSLKMWVRTAYGIGESRSTDGGATWSPGEPSGIPHVSSRFFARRLRSGNLLLVKHGPMTRTPAGRSELMAFLSEDDGNSWIGGLMLDERDGVSYPDGVEGDGGRICVIYDHSRFGDKEILLAVFTEEDVRAGRLNGPDSRLRRLVSRAP